MTLCTTKTELLRSYNEALKVYSDLISRLNAAKDKSELYEVSEEWRVRAEAERETLDKHVKAHNC